MKFVELEEARRLSGLRLVVVGGVPSPWSQGAMGVLDLRGVDYVAVRFRPGDEDLRRWTKADNAPVALLHDEPPRTGWAEILEMAESLEGGRPIVPAAPDARVQLFGLSHEILGEGGLAWNLRLLLVHDGLSTGGARGWPAKLAEYLATKYGYAPERAPRARARVIAVLSTLTRTLAASRAVGHQYLLGPEPTALDVYCACALAPIVPLPHELCPMPAPIRRAFDTIDPEIRESVGAALLAHRELMFARHLTLPVRC
jgi:glutathione S-transferase